MSRFLPLSHRELNARTANGEDVFVNGESSSRGKRSNNGAVRNKIPLNSILRRMAEKVLHEKVVRKQKKDRRRSRLTEAQVRDIRAKFTGRPSMTKTLAEQYGISEGYADKIGRGETHRYVI